MEILVNNESLDFTLEDERSVGEVIDGLSEWLGLGDFAITDIEVDQESYPVHDRARWQDLSVDRVSRLSVEALPLSDMDQVTLAALDQYCGLLIAALSDERSDALPELAEELPFVRSRIYQFFPILKAGDNVEILASDALENGRMPGPAECETLIRQAGQLRGILASRLQEYMAPERELAIALGKLAASGSALTEVPVQLQVGDHASAMRTVTELAENMSKVLRLVPMASSESIDLDGVKRFAQELSPQLVELKEAFESEDSVLVGDLLEYEIAPRLADLAGLVRDELE